MLESPTSVPKFGASQAASTCQHTLLHLNRRLHRGEELSALISETKEDLAAAHKMQAPGAPIRAQVQWAEEGEASTAFFFRLEKKRGKRRIFHSTRNVGQVVSSFAAISKAWISTFNSLPRRHSTKRRRISSSSALRKNLLWINFLCARAP